MPTQYEHANESEDCPICGIEFAHNHLDTTKPKEFIYRGLEMERVTEGEVSPDGKASVAMVQREEWYESDLAELTSAIINGDYDLRDEVMRSILAEHRKQIIKEIREEINNMELARNSPWAVEAVLSLPCLKENE